jgi:hypothetical protein
MYLNTSASVTDLADLSCVPLAKEVQHKVVKPTTLGQLLPENQNQSNYGQINGTKFISVS